MGKVKCEGSVKIRWFTKSDVVYLREYVCWSESAMCGRLFYCGECKKFECALGLALSKVVCPSRVEAVVEYV